MQTLPGLAPEIAFAVSLTRPGLFYDNFFFVQPAQQRHTTEQHIQIRDTKSAEQAFAANSGSTNSQRSIGPEGQPTFPPRAREPVLADLGLVLINVYEVAGDP